MSYTDVTNPVIVNVSTTSQFSVDNYLRRMCIVSPGDSKLAVGEFKEVDTSTYANFVTKGTETEKNFISFFAYAGSKPVLLLEVGSDSLSSQCTAIKSFLDSDALKVFNIVVPTSYFNVKVPGKTYSAFMSAQTFIPAEQSQSIPLILTNIDNGALKLGSTSEKIDIDLSKLTYKLKAGQTLDAAETIELKATIDGEDKKICDLIFNETGGSQTTEADFSYTESDTEDLSFVKLATEWNDISKENIFFLSFPRTEDPSASANWVYFKGLASILPVANNAESATFNTHAMVCGITANSIFDISESVPASSLNYKALKGSNISEYNRAMKKALIDAPITFISELAGNNVVLNGLCGDGKAWDWYYYWYLTEYRVNSKLTTLLLNGANNPVAAVKFNQDGIDTIHANIVSVLEECKNQGIITDFAQSYDSATGTLENSGDIICPSYYTYIAQYPADYADEVLKGISVYIQIGKFIRQVVWNVSLGS